MNLFNLVDNKVVVSPEALLIKDFSVLSPTELAYVFYIQDYKSPYSSYAPETREETIKKDLGLKAIGVREEVMKACQKYSELQETPTMKLLKAARGGVDKFKKYFEDKGPSDRNYGKNLEIIGKLLESIDKLEERVKKEVSVESRAKGGRSINTFEE